MIKHTCIHAAVVAGLAMLCPVAAQAQATNHAQPDLTITAQSRPISIDVLANDDNFGPRTRLAVTRRPQHGRASISGGQVLYRPNSGFLGTDSFEYRAFDNGRVGWATVTVDVGEALIVSGKVTDQPIANAEVDASVGGHGFTAQADGNGDYSLEVIAVDGDDMLVLGARGVGDQAAVSFLSVVGQFDRLQAESGGDGVLTRDENNQVQVTNLSTAQAYLLQAANGGEPIADDAELVAARESLDNGQLLQQAAAIKLVVDGGYALPAGVSDTLELISNADALSGFLSTVNADNPSALSEAMAQVASDPDVTVPTTADDMVGTYTLMFELGATGTISNGYIQGNRMTLEADGSGSFVIAAPNVDPAVSWTFENGRAVVIPQSPVVHVGFPFIPGKGQVRAFNTTTRYEVSKLFEGNGRDTLAVTATTHTSYPDNPELPDETRSPTSTNTGIRDETGILPYLATELADSTRALWIAGTTYTDANFTGSELFTFFDGGSGQRSDGPTFSWSIDALGRLLVDYPNGNQSVYARLNVDGRKGEGVAGQWRGSDGTHSAASSMSMALDDGFSFTTANAERDWRGGFYISRTTLYPDNTDLYFVLGTGQAGWQVGYGADQEAFPTRLGWTVNGGRMDASYYRDGSNQAVHFCQVGVDGCYVWYVRRWRPVAADGDRIYVIEEFLYDFDGDGVLDIFNQRPNFYEAGTAPPFTP